MFTHVTLYESFRVGFNGGRKTGELGEKPSKQGRGTNKLNSHMTQCLGIEPGTTEVRGKCSHHYTTHASLR
jgi:hypothetical protein